MLSVMMGLAMTAGQPQGVVSPPPAIMTPSIVIAASPPPLPPLNGPVPTVRAKTNLVALFSTDDYPMAALRNEEMGTVAFAARVNRDGRVAQCEITTSSGSTSLDVTTCTIVQRRARFTPARDAAGRVVEDRVTGRINWVLPPRPSMPFVENNALVVFTINLRGELTNCRTEGSAQQAPSDKVCAELMAKARAVAAEAGKKTAINGRELVFETGFLIGGPDGARGIGRARGQSLVYLVALVLDVDASGTVTRCVETEYSLDSIVTDEVCEDNTPLKFVELGTAAGNRTERHAVLYWAKYTRPIN